MPTSKTLTGIRRNANMGSVALTTAEESITVASPAPGRGRNPEITVFSDVAWLYDSVSGAADANRILFAANQVCALRFDGDSMVFYAKLAAGTGTLYIMRTG